jgi:hypothetical protein
VERSPFELSLCRDRLLAAEAGIHYQPGLDVSRNVRRVKARRATGTRTGIRQDAIAASGRWLLRKRCSRRAPVGESRPGPNSQRGGHDSGPHAETES